MCSLSLRSDEEFPVIAFRLLSKYSPPLRYRLKSSNFLLTPSAFAATGKVC